MYLGTPNDYGVASATASAPMACDVELGATGHARAIAFDTAARHVWVGTDGVVAHCTPVRSPACSDTCVELDVFLGASDDTAAMTFDGANTVSAADDLVWVGSLSRGLARVRTSDDAVLGTLTSATGLPSDRVQALAVDVANGVVWIGTDNGLARLTKATGVIAVYRAVHGLPADNVRALAPDPPRQRLYVGTTSGVVYTPLTP
jgi:hypothetical protein